MFTASLLLILIGEKNPVFHHYWYFGYQRLDSNFVYKGMCMGEGILHPALSQTEFLLNGIFDIIQAS